jgi:carbon-monoxide dehydrogenase medium subunit
VKAPPFTYSRPTSVGEAIEALAADPEAKTLAGGQSLVPMLVMRLARPTTLVDINQLGELAELEKQGSALRVGTLVRQRDLERHPLAADVPLLAAALPHVGHRELRNRGSVGGSIAHADPAAELPAVAVTLGATLTARGPGGQRDIPAAEFFTGPFQTTLTAGELLTAARFPTARPGDGFAFDEVARRHGDFAICGLAAAVHIEGGRLTAATLGLFGVGDVPVRIEVTDLVSEADPDEQRLAEIGRQVAERISPSGDLHGSAGYRKRLAATLTARCLHRALADAQGDSSP